MPNERAAKPRDMTNKVSMNGHRKAIGNQSFLGSLKILLPGLISEPDGAVCELSVWLRINDSGGGLEVVVDWKLFRYAASCALNSIRGLSGILRVPKFDLNILASRDTDSTNCSTDGR